MAQRRDLQVLRHVKSDMTLELTLPIPPSINHQYATVMGRRILSAQGRSYKRLVGQQVLLTLSTHPNRDRLRTLFEARDLRLSMWFHFRSPLRRDLDSGLKITQDAICEALGVNDNRIMEIHLHKRSDPADPRLDVTLAAIGDDSE